MRNLRGRSLTSTLPKIPSIGEKKKLKIWNPSIGKRPIQAVAIQMAKKRTQIQHFLVPDIAIWTPPGSGTGLIPLCLPRQERMVNQGLTQLKSLQRGVFASLNLSMALSFYDIQISSDYRLFSKILPLFLSKKTNLPVYSMIILSPSTIFLLLSPGPSFFPRPTFQNQTTNQFPYSSQQIKDDKSMETTTSKNLSMNYIVFTNKNTCLLYTSPSPRDS